MFVKQLSIAHHKHQMRQKFSTTNWPHFRRPELLATGQQRGHLDFEHQTSLRRVARSLTNLRMRWWKQRICKSSIESSLVPPTFHSSGKTNSVAWQQRHVGFGHFSDWTRPNSPLPPTGHMSETVRCSAAPRTVQWQPGGWLTVSSKLTA